ncbi:MAG: FadR/GntR family transcriptional regulator [Oscillospiraceae bacterium]|nr:FadR/GntR family transcriptional regulator [Oscillospiraceae bacterium]
MSGPIFRIKLYEDVANRIMEGVRGGEWEAGARLPTEAQLAERFDVSRSTIREAVKSLQIAGILRSRTGSGTYVADRARMMIETRELAAIMGNPEYLNDLVEARYILEPQLAAMAAVAASPEEKQRLLSIVNRMREKNDRFGLMTLGYQFHKELAEMSHNRVLVGVYQSADSQMRGMRVLESLTLEIYRQGIEDHQRIADAVLRGDAGEAKKQMRRHLLQDYAAYLPTAETLD